MYSDKRKSLPIGVFDSGVGGFSVVKALREKLPNESIYYLGDTARVPYGTKSPATVIRYSLKNGKFLVDQGIKMLVVACNTASAQSIPSLRKSFDIPVLGVIKPGAIAAIAATENGKIGVIGTYGTITSGAYETAISENSGRAIETGGLPCPMFVSLADEGWVSGEIPALIARKYLSELKKKMGDMDVLVLGCTHYPILRKIIQNAADDIFGHRVELIDSGVATGKVISEILKVNDMENNSNKPGDLSVFVTDLTRINEVGERFLGSPLNSIERVDI